MAVLSKIRDRSLFLILVIGLALFAFVLDPSTLTDFFNSSKINEVGEVNGETISRQEFVNELDQYRQQTGGRTSDIQAARIVWDNMLRKKIYDKQLVDAGITIGEEDVWNEIISAPFVQNNPQYQNEVGQFDEDKFKKFLADTKENNEVLWGQWSNYMNQVRDNAGTNTYNNLVTAGLGASLKESEFQYLIDNTKLTGQFVYVPYSSVPDSLVTVTRSEIESYVKANEKDFKVEDMRDIFYVEFKIEPTKEDEDAIKAEVAGIANDLKSSTDEKLLLSENDSDLDMNPNFQFESYVNQEISKDLFATKLGDVFGPYKDKEYFKLSKVIEESRMPDSARASHILVPYIGAQRAAADITRSKEAAKKMADSIFNIVKRNKKKFAEIAKEVSSDRGSAEKGGDLDWFNYNRMTPAFRDFCFTERKGKVDVVETPFGYHIIRIDDQKNFQRVVKLATYAKQILPSEKTENAAYTKAQEFALEVTNTNDFGLAAKNKGYAPKPAVGMKTLDENVPGLGNHRQVVSWAFGSETNIGDFKRFDLEGSYVVATLSGKTAKGLMSPEKATPRVRPILLNEKKAEILEDRFVDGDLQANAKELKVALRTANGVTLKSPTLPGIGLEPKVIGAMYNAEVNKVYTAIVGQKGVFAFKVTKKEEPVALPNYETNRKQIAEARRRMTFRIYNALKEASEIEDNRAMMYSSN
ncbi:MAG: peptidylprolyl isomerase [Flavobacteriaceae bacterium]|nr:peptidylprolyl isomerase [Flavobacteriaceae bacterium]|tara:strand:- start:19621 stop:21711 length:2091 start_codon:yes stop_codon:yes gene_type:complete